METQSRREVVPNNADIHVTIPLFNEKETPKKDQTTYTYPWTRIAFLVTSLTNTLIVGMYSLPRGQRAFPKIKSEPRI